MPSANTTRRTFVASTAAAAAFTIIKPSQVRGSTANSTVTVGLIGCGNRGKWIAKLFQGHGGYKFVATHDYFAERANEAGDLLEVPANQRFDKLSGYQRLVECDLDGVVIESPPYFHPGHAAAAVAAGKHTYVAKPIAVDVPGCQTIGDSGKKATENSLAFLVDFQTRADPFYIEALKRFHDSNAIGDIVFGEASYHASVPWTRHLLLLEKNPDDPETRLAAWGLDRDLSGDIITEQNIHTLDVMNWIMQKPPERVWGTCGKRGRKDTGTCNDHFALTYEYANRVGITFSSRQFQGHGTQPEGIRNRMFGADGVLETKYGGDVLIRGKNFYRGGSTGKIYLEGAQANIAQFHKQITEKRYDNVTVEPSVQSNLVTIMGRMAAYSGDVVTWEQLLNNEEPLQPLLKGLKS